MYPPAKQWHVGSQRRKTAWLAELTNLARHAYNRAEKRWRNTWDASVVGGVVGGADISVARGGLVCGKRTSEATAERAGKGTKTTTFADGPEISAGDTSIIISGADSFVPCIISADTYAL